MVKDAIAHECRSDNFVDVVDSLENAFAEITAFIAVTEFESFIFAGGCAGRNSCATNSTAFENDINFNRRVAAGVYDFTTDNFRDFCHYKIPLSLKTN